VTRQVGDGGVFISAVVGMAARGFGRIVNITSSAVKALIDILGLSNGARTGQSVEVVSEARHKAIPAQRFGDPTEFGAICAFLCSQHAGYMTGQNVLADGGAYPGTF
jgi:3-oxoacyl-[acyl-carrier protein] reductase